MKVLLLGYLDNNIGDDLIIEEIANSFSGIDFYIYNKNSQFKETFSSLQNIFIINEDIHNVSTLNFDFCIKVGGSMYIMQNKYHYLHRIREIKLARKIKKNNIPSAVIGSNYGPFKNNFGKFLVKKELSYKKLITVRDNESYSILQSFNFKGKVTGVYDDVVYNLKLKNQNQNQNIIGISVYNSSSIKDKKNYYFNLSYICSELVKQGYLVRLFAFDCENENDLISCYHIKKQVTNSENIKIIPYTGERNEFLRSFSECSKIIATRFHAAILSDILNIPFIPILYSNKMENFLIDKGYRKKLIWIEDLLIINNCNYIINCLINNENLFNNFSDQKKSEGHLILLKNFFSTGE